MSWKELKMAEQDPYHNDPQKPDEQTGEQPQGSAGPGPDAPTGEPAGQGQAAPPPAGEQPSAGGFTDAPPPPVGTAPDKDARLWAMLCHVAAAAQLLGIPFGNVLGPLVIWLIKKDEHPFIDANGKESLNFQITVAIAIVVCIPLFFCAGIGAILAGAIGIADIIFVIIAAIKANNGESYRYPLTIRLIK
jgi:uncharacterized Tic20 family protein